MAAAKIRCAGRVTIRTGNGLAMYENSIMSKTDQNRKGLIGLLGLLASVALFGFVIYQGQTGTLAFDLLGLATVIGIAGFAYPVLTIRCPGCGDRWLWRAMSTQPHPRAMKWLAEQERCPNCDATFTP